MLFDAKSFCDKENNVSFDSKSNTIHHKGCKFNKKWEGKVAVTYWCSNCKSSKSKCSYKIKVDFFGKVVHESGSHDVECKIKNKGSVQALQDLTNAHNNNPKSEGIDYTSYMKKRVDELALENIHLFPKDIWGIISKDMNKKFTTWRGLTDNQVTSRVRNVRAQLQGSDLLRNIENSELARMKNSNNFFYNLIAQ